MHRNSARIAVAGQSVNWLGASFWSPADGPLMWRNYDPDTVRANRPCCATTAHTAAAIPRVNPEATSTVYHALAPFGVFVFHLETTPDSQHPGYPTAR